MPPVAKTLPIASLQLDVQNPRLPEGSATQREAIQAMLRAEGAKTIALAQDIASQKLNPTEKLAVVAGPEPKRYTVLEGNRRLTALRLLAEPSLADGVLTGTDIRTLKKAAATYANSPLSNADCVIFASREEAAPWIERRHTGQQGGVGLVAWGNLEKERFKERSTGESSPALQVLDFVTAHGTFDASTTEAVENISLTNLKRLISDKDVREHLGVTLSQGRLITAFPNAEVLKGLQRVVVDVATRLKVADIYSHEDRLAYLDSIASHDLPSRKSAGKTPRALVSGAPLPNAPAKQIARSSRRHAVRQTAAPTALRLKIGNQRISDIFRELQSIKLEKAPNAAAILLRVFLELSCDHAITSHGLLAGPAHDRATLGAKVTTVKDFLVRAGKLSTQEAKAVDKISHEKRMLGTNIATLHQYVHNFHVTPSPTDVRAAWDNMQVLFERIWQ